MERPPFEASAYYHVYNRGTDKRDTFLDDWDYRRFIHLLYACNDTAPLERVREENKLLKGPSLSGKQVAAKKALSNQKLREREMLVDIVAYALMPNHVHLLLCPKTDEGLSKFMQKVMTAYTMYFNAKYKRTGALFQGVFKSKEVSNEQYLPILIRYIHRNPVKLMSGFHGVAAGRAIEAFLRKYKWSSCPDYLGVNNFPLILTQELFLEAFQNKDEHKEFLLESQGDFEEGEDPALADLTFDEE